ncbi:MAG: glutamyl-Q tRNA(Asp) synthetase [Kiritimatiellia bacterium]|jgi:glutamyl-Q tRNA(Asp) synthetase
MKPCAKPSTYIGRFAPSPSGPLHFGSLVTALASYLDAKHYGGQWLVRMEDIDPPREKAGADHIILASLLAHGLAWDGSVMYQSTRLAAYAEILSTLGTNTYPCQCTRQRLLNLKGVYDNHCSRHLITDSNNRGSTRVKIDALDHEQLFAAEHYADLFQGEQIQSLAQDTGDFILRRKDGLFAYQLAVVIDDIEQGVNHIIRGSDLLSSSPRQRYLTLLLQQELGIKSTLPIYGHLPIATNQMKQKLSKQTKAKAIDNRHAFVNLSRALAFLQQIVPAEIIADQDISTLMNWAIQHWQRKNIPQTLAIVVEV